MIPEQAAPADGAGFVDINITEKNDNDAATGSAGGVSGGYSNKEDQNGTTSSSNSAQATDANDFVGLLDVELTQQDGNNYGNSPSMTPTSASNDSIGAANNANTANTANNASDPYMMMYTSARSSTTSSTKSGTKNIDDVSNATRSAGPQSLMAPDNEQFHADRNNNNNNNSNSNNANGNTSAYSSRSLSNRDLNIIQQLDEEFQNTLIEREIGWNARYISVRQNAGLSLWFMVLFLTVGTIFFDYNTDWTLGESLLFSVYTITTVGYGRHEFPREPGVLFFISVYIFLGIATLTIMAAQLYQWVVLELTWARYEHDKQLSTLQHETNMQAANEIEGVHPHGPIMDLSEAGEVKTKKSCAVSTLDFAVVVINKVQKFVKDYPYGQIIVVMVPFWFLICLGALFVGTIEEWSFMESMYFSVVSLTTVGYGDYYPDKPATRWFCIIWLPFSVFFVSLYLGSVAGFYIEMSGRNIKRIERRLRKRMDLFKTWQEREKEAARLRGLSGGFDANIGNEDERLDVPSHIKTPPTRENKKNGFDIVSSSSPDSHKSPRGPKSPRTKNRRKEILANSGLVGIDQEGEHTDNSETMKTMKDVITAIKMNMSSSRRTMSDDQSDMLENGIARNNEALNVHSTSFYNTSRGIAKKPTFALRVLVQERLAQIIAHEVAGYQSSVSIKNNTLSVTIESLKHTCEKWYIPRRATKNFRSVAFEILYFVGERQLIVKGADAVFELRPKEVQGLFGPVLAALGDSGTMEAWLNRTHSLAEAELNSFGDDKDFKLNLVDDRRMRQVTQNMTSDPKHQRTVIGNAFSN